MDFGDTDSRHQAVTPDFGQLKLGSLGQVTLAGTLEATSTEGTPAIGATFPIITSYQRSRHVQNLVLPPGLQLNYHGRATSRFLDCTVYCDWQIVLKPKLKLRPLVPVEK